MVARDDPSTNVSPGVDVSIDDGDDALSPVFSASTEDSPADHLLNIESHRFQVAQGQQELLSIEEIKDRIKLLEHQLNAAHKALFKFGEGALFADEVGLGKTIEIGMVLKEMDFRETHKSFLVLTPAQLAPQWQSELEAKFGLDFVCNYDDEFAGFAEHDKIVASVDTAKSSRHREEVLSRQWDVLVLDEAHYVRNEDTQRYELIDEIDYQKAFFATATPLQNDISDLYNIINLIWKGLFGSREQFNQRYVADGEGVGVKNADELQEKLDKVMIRNRREETKIDFTNRKVHSNSFEPTAEERALDEAVTEYVRTHYSNQDARHLVMLMLQKEAVSSPAAVSGTVEKWLSDGGRNLSQTERLKLEEIRDMAASISPTTKQQRLRDVIENIQDSLSTTRVIVFTQFRPTQDAIAESVRQLDEPVHVVNGDYSSREKDQIVGEFKEDGGVLVATDSISEGRNMQFCNVLVNYDLPWNPMKVEQRIGRVDRIGQNREVHVFNLLLEDTVEEQVENKLYGKIDLFNKSIGGLRDILSKMEKSGSDFEREVFDRLRHADDQVELENNFEEMAVDLEKNKEASDKMGDFNERVFDNFEFSEGTS